MNADNNRHQPENLHYAPFCVFAGAHFYTKIRSVTVSAVPGVKSLASHKMSIEQKHTLEREAKSIEKLLAGKILAGVVRHQSNEVLLQFSDGTRLFVNAQEHGSLDFSVTGGLHED